MTETAASDTVAIYFHRSSSPYESGDVAGFPPPIAQRYIDSGYADLYAAPAIATAGVAPTADEFAAMDRAALIAFAKANLGMTDEPPAEESDDALRDALRAAQAAKPPKTGKAK